MTVVAGDHIQSRLLLFWCVLPPLLLALTSKQHISISRLFFKAYLANIPGLNVLQFNQQLVITAGLELFYKNPTVSRLLVHRKHKKLVNVSSMHLRQTMTPIARLCRLLQQLASLGLKMLQEVSILTASVGVFFNLLLSTFIVDLKCSCSEKKNRC